MLLSLLSSYFLLSCTAYLFIFIPAALLLNALFYRYRGRPLSETDVDTPVSLIKPLKGRDAELLENLQSHVDHRPPGKFQMILALESGDDPAYPIALQIHRQNPGVDIEVLITGPSRDRMGKAHNMIEACKHAKYPVWVFSDGDVRIDRRGFERALYSLSRADGAFCPVYYAPPPNLAAAAVTCATNYNYFPLLACLDYVHYIDFCGGGFMIFKRSAIEKIGGLEQFAHHIAEDAALGRALYRAGKAPRVIPHALSMHASAVSCARAFSHLKRWAIAVWSALGWRYFLFLPTFILLNLAGYWMTICAGAPAILSPQALLGSYLVLRPGSAVLLDLLLRKKAATPWVYPYLLFTDVLYPLGWCLPFFTRTLEWRGKRYCVSPGGQARVI